MQNKYIGIKYTMSNDYRYEQYVKPPEQIGMSSKGDLKTLGKNITGLIAYTDLLVSGGGKASSTGGSLGNKYFLNSLSKCKDGSGGKQDKYAFINNVSDSGLIPGLIGSMMKINPASIISGAFQSGTPECREITLETIDSNNNKKLETHYVAVSDIDRDGLKNLKQGFKSMTEQSMTEPKIPKDNVTQIYFASLALLSVLLFYKMVVNRSH
jgi:hypothetical protein